MANQQSMFYLVNTGASPDPALEAVAYEPTGEIATTQRAMLATLESAIASLTETMQQVADAANRTAANTAPRGGPLADPNMLSVESRMFDYSRYSPFGGG